MSEGGLHGKWVLCQQINKQTHVPLCSHVLLLHLSFYLSINSCSFCFLSCSDTHVRMLEDCIQETIIEQNKLAAGSDRSVRSKERVVQMILTLVLLVILKVIVVDFRLMAIQQCELVLVHIYPQGEDTLVSDRPKKEVGEKLDGQHLIKINHYRK